ncbi:GDF3 factor, partial [Spizella passerina]|nr:GDF3 factor [Spizella passerina]
PFPQERSLLRSLGLSARPSPRSPAPVPPVLWSIFHRRSARPRPQAAPEPCRVEELSVPGDIVRVLADQGTAPLLPSCPVPRGRSRIPGEIPAGWSPVDAAGDGFGARDGGEG